MLLDPTKDEYISPIGLYEVIFLTLILIDFLIKKNLEEN
jgi:hypothetical protein